MASDITFGDELLFPNEYLSHVDLNGKELSLTIGVMSKQEMRLKTGGKKVKPVIEFRIGEHPGCTAKNGALKCPCQKKFVVNVTNAETIKFVTGERVAEKWTGQQITFFVGRTHSPNGIVDCLRIREKKPDSPPPPAEEPAKSGPIHPGWFKKLKEIKKVEVVPKLFADFIKAHTDLELQKVFGEACDQRHAEIKAEQAPAQPEPKEELL